METNIRTAVQISQVPIYGLLPGLPRECYPDTIFTVGVLESYDGAGMNGRKKWWIFFLSFTPAPS